MILTPDQERALALDRHCAVIANAGSGKTRVLTERYMRIVRDGHATVDGIVAMTFTTKAAAEMRHRIRQRLDDVGTPRCRDAAQRMATARIATIHSFCGALVRQYGSTIGLDADLRDLAPRETARLQQEALRTAVTEALRHGHALRHGLLLALDELGRDIVADTIRAMLASRERCDRWSTWTSLSTQERLEQRERACRHVLGQRLQALAATLTDRLRPAADREAALQEVTDAVVGIGRQLADLADDDPRPFAERLLTAHDKVYTKEGKPRKTGGPVRRLDEVLEPVGRTLRGQIETIATTAWDADTEQRSLDVVDAMVRTGDLAMSVLQRMKQDRGVMDVDDLVATAHILLAEHPDVAHDVRRRIRFLMVDEFQDTDPLQYDIVRLLVPDLDGPTSGPVPNLFLVGDPKQSIYGFRDADVRLFLRAIDDIREANRRNGAADDGVIRLSASFRMAPPLAPVVDLLCERPSARRSAYDVPYDRLVVGRPDREGTGSTTILVTERRAAADRDEDTSEEARHVVDHVLGILSAPGNHYHPRDIAILVRDMASAADIVTCLREANLPSIVHGGKAFFDRPEIMDLEALLRWCSDADDDMALATLLRSPWIRCSESDLLLLASMPREGAWWERLQTACRNGTAPPHWQALRDTLQHGIDDLQTMSVPSMVRRMMTRTSWYAAIHADRRREQIVANMEKALAMLQETMARPGATVQDAVETLSASETGGGERDGIVHADTDAVQVLTMHAAKGLEFPVVVVAGFSRSPARERPVQWTDPLGLTVSLAEEVTTPGDPPSDSRRPASMSATVQRFVRQDIDDAERQRLLYVAVTRAVDHLVVSLPYSRTASGEAGSRQGMNAMIAEALHDVGDCLDAGTIVVTSVVRRYAAGQETTEPMTVRIDVRTPSAGPPPAPFTAATVARPSLDLAAPLLHHRSIDMVSVTDLLDPVLLIDEPSASTITDAVHETSGTAYGTIVHYLLQHALAPEAPHDRDQCRAYLADLVATRSMTDEARDAALEDVLRTLSAPVVERHRQRWTSFALETARTAALPTTTLYGVMDLVGTGTDGTVDVWDWKTTSVTTADAADHALEHYRPQLEAYAWLMFRSDPDVAAVRASLVFVRRMPAEDAVVTLRYERPDVAELADRLEVAVAALIHRRTQRFMTETADRP